MFKDHPIRDAIIGIGFFAILCSIMPFICGYGWTYGDQAQKVKSGLEAASMVFIYVFSVLSLVSWASMAGTKKGNSDDNLIDNGSNDSCR